MPTRVFQRFCDAFLLLFLLFVGNMIKQLISEVTVCLFSFSSLQTMCKLKKKKYHLCSQYYSWPEILRKSFFPDRKQFNLATAEGRCSVGGTCTVSAIQSRRLLLLPVEQQKLYYAQGLSSIFCNCCIVPRNVPAQTGSRSDVATTCLIWLGKYPLVSSQYVAFVRFSARNEA